MADSLIFDHGPNGRYLTLDASGRIIATAEPYDAFYEYGYGDTGRAVVVDGSGRLGVTIDGVVSGETNTVSNIGTGSGLVYSTKSGVDLQLRSLIAGSGIAIVTSGNVIWIDNTNHDDIALAEADIISNYADFTNASGNMVAATTAAQSTADDVTTDVINASGNMVAATTAAQDAADAVQTEFTNASGYWEDLIVAAEGEGLDFANASGNMVATTTAAQAAADDVTTDFTNISGVWESEINLNTQGVLDFNNSSGVIGSAGLEVGGNVWTPVSSGTVDENETINLSLSDVHRLHWMDGINSTLTLSNPKTGGKYTFVLVNAQGGDGAVVWPAEVLWQNGDGMTSLTPGTNSIDVVGLTYDGENYFAASGYAFA